MCKNCKNCEACATLGIPPSITPRKEACFESETSFSLIDAMRTAQFAPPVTRYASDNESNVRVS